MATRKVLYSPGYGAGWTTWESDPKIKAFMLEYAPIIEYLEGGGTFSGKDCHDQFGGELHPILVKFKKDCMEKFGECPYLGGADDLEVAEVSGPVRITEYDGSESLFEQGSDEGWI